MTPLFSSNGYVRDLLANYGNGGKPFDLPQTSRKTYEQGLEFRRKEKAHYAELEKRLHAAEKDAADVRARWDIHEAQLFKSFANEFLKNMDEAHGANHPWARRSHTRSHDRRGVLPPKSDPRETEPDDGPIISSIKPADNGSSSDRFGSTRRNVTTGQNAQDTGGGALEDAGARGPLHRSPNGAESDVDRQAGQHNIEE